MKKFAWSYSALNNFETCPKQFYHLRIKKDIVEQPSAQMQDGNRQHKMLELRIKNKKPLPSDMIRWEKLCQKVESVPNAKIITEEKLALTADLKPTTFFAKDVWMRAVIDLSVLRGAVARVVDFKTGRRKVDSTQLKLFAATMFAVRPEIKKVITSFWWLKERKTDHDEFTVDEVPLIWQEFEPRVERMRLAHETDDWPARPSGLCRGWCPVKHCEWWEPKANG